MRRSDPRPRRTVLAWLALLGLGLGLPALAQQGAQVASGACSTMGPMTVEIITVAVLVGSLIALALMERRLRAEGWSLAEALSESVSRPGGATHLEASSSRLIAMAGMLVLLLLYLGFGIFALYNFGRTCTMPSSIDTVTHFLYAGLTLFAPYIANKFSNVFRPMFLRGRTASDSSDNDNDNDSDNNTAKPAAPAAGSEPVARTAPSAAAPIEAARPAATAPPHAAAVATTPVDAKPAKVSPAPEVADPYAPAVSLIAEFEGFVDHAYPDPASGGEPWTIGYGFTQLQGRAVRPGDTISRS